MVIGIDFDGTFTSDPVMFREIVRVMRAFGHTPIMVTQRCIEHAAEIRAIVQIPDLHIVYASGQSKESAAQLAGFTIQFWVDDNPVSVVTSLSHRDCP
jgi:hypothetical protein